MKRTVNLDDAMYALGDAGFLIYQHQNEETDQFWLDICQVLRSIHKQPVPHFLTALEVHAKRDGELVVDRDDLRAILKQPSELPGDYVPEPRYEIPVPPVDVREEFAALAEDEDDELGDEDDEDADEDEVDYAAEFRRMAE